MLLESEAGRRKSLPWCYCLSRCSGIYREHGNIVNSQVLVKHWHTGQQQHWCIRCVAQSHAICCLKFHISLCNISAATLCGLWLSSTCNHASIRQDHIWSRKDVNIPHKLIVKIYCLTFHSLLFRYFRYHAFNSIGKWYRRNVSLILTSED